MARRKILPLEIESRVLAAFEGRPLFRKTSCGVAYAHGAADFNGHFGVADICDICTSAQVGRCAAAHRIPSRDDAVALAELAGLDSGGLTLEEGRISLDGSTEQQRYFMQHTLNYQVHDRAHPHLPRRHGRAELGWT